MSAPVQNPLRLFDSLTRSVRDFAPIEPGHARVYSCGPTVYHYAHLGNLRAYVFTDTLTRALRWKGLEVTHVINITDVGHLTSDADAGDDKMALAAAREAKTIWDVARFYTDAFKADVKALNIVEPTRWSVATDHIAEMIAFAERIAPKHCYEIDSGLYFDSTTVPDYGKLAGARSDVQEARIDEVSGKRHPSDFAIWRKSPPGEQRQMEWESPWGKGAPGWHLECSVMSQKYLGDQFDIHTGGIDHREIHHPNEIAQNQAATCSSATGANWWMHNNFLVDRSGKMSKSGGEFLTLNAIIEKGFHPRAFRLMCLQAHYRSELEFSWQNLESASVRLQRLIQKIRQISGSSKVLTEVRRMTDELGNLSGGAIGELSARLSWPLQAELGRFGEAIADDLNTPKAITILEQVIKQKELRQSDRVRFVALADAVLGLDLLRLTRRKLRVIKPGGTVSFAVSDKDIEAVVRARRLMRHIKRFDIVDNLKGVLNDWGVEVMDGDPLGWDWKIEV